MAYIYFWALMKTESLISTWNDYKRMMRIKAHWMHITDTTYVIKYLPVHLVIYF